ncbi:MAG: phosphatase PAP2 family protein [Simkaniaceae bacterium]|nr:phosphatase PAP2 family protein [Simkaniaceae bacterium]
MVSLLFFIDQSLARWISALPQVGVSLARFLSVLGEPAFHSLFWPCLALIFRKAPFIHLGIAAFLSGSFSTLIKICAGRSRPSLFLTTDTFTWIGFTFRNEYHSFPSGHAALTFALASSIAFQFPKWSFLAFSLATLISLSRLLLSYHYFTDILGGALLSLSLASIVNYLGILWMKNIQTTPSTPSF